LPFSRTPPIMPEPSSDLRIFRFSDGTRERAVDPQLAHRKLTIALGGDMEQVFKSLDCPVESVSFKALDRALDATRQAFGLAPIDDDGKGTTEEETMGILLKFLDFVSKKTPVADPRRSPRHLRRRRP